MKTCCHSRIVAASLLYCLLNHATNYYYYYSCQAFTPPSSSASPFLLLQSSGNNKVLLIHRHNLSWNDDNEYDGGDYFNDEAPPRSSTGRGRGRGGGGGRGRGGRGGNTRTPTRRSGGRGRGRGDDNGASAGRGGGRGGRGGRGTSGRDNNFRMNSSSRDDNGRQSSSSYQQQQRQQQQEDRPSRAVLPSYNNNNSNNQEEYGDDDDDDDGFDYPQQRERMQSRSPSTSSTSSSSTFSSSSNAIDCPHFGTCPGCIVDKNVHQVDIVESAKLYFSSTSIQKHVLNTNHGRNSRSSNRYNNNNNNNNNNGYYDNNNDNNNNGYYDSNRQEFYKVIVPSPLTQWRTQAKLAIQPISTWSRSSGCSIGLYQRHTHKVLAIPDCAVHHPSINKAVDMIRIATAKVRTPPYMEDTGFGLLRYIQLQVELSSGKICLTLVMNAEKLKQCQPHLSYLVSELKKMDKDSDEERLFHSIWCHCNDSAGNAIFARDASRWHPVEGPPFIRERIPGSEEDGDGGVVGEEEEDKREGLLYFSPMVFRQGNLEGFGKIAKEVREAIPMGSKVCELYAGVGVLGLSALLHHGKLADAEYHEREEDDEDGGGSSGTSGTSGGGLGWLRCSDENPENLRCFERTVNSMPKHMTGRTPKSFQQGDKKGKRQRKTKYDDNRRSSMKGKPAGGELSIKDLMDTMMVSDSSSSSRLSSTDDESTEKVTYMVANAATALFKGQALGANVVIVDPPRKGLEEAVLQQLCLPYNPNQPYVEKPAMLSHLARHTINWTNDVRTLIYVSCGFDALARDCDTLLSSSAGWKLESATGYVLFPGSNHVESVVVFRR